MLRCESREFNPPVPALPRPRHKPINGWMFLRRPGTPLIDYTAIDDSIINAGRAQWIAGRALNGFLPLLLCVFVGGGEGVRERGRKGN